MPVGTRERLLDVAEELFAEKGIAATSLRTLTTAAETNLAAVHYHFGSKNGLVDAVLDRPGRGEGRRPLPDPGRGVSALRARFGRTAPLEKHLIAD